MAYSTTKYILASFFIYFLASSSIAFTQSKTTFQFQDELLKEVFSENNNTNTTRFLVTIPGANGQLYPTLLESDALIGKDLKEKYPNHQNYKIIEINGKKSTGKILVSPTGVFINHHTTSGLVSIYPDQESNLYFLEKGIVDKEAMICGVKETIQNNQSRSILTTNGDFLRSYRMAIIATGEFYQANGNNDSDVMSWVMFSLNGLNTIFEIDMAMRFDLGNRIFLYNNPNSDPFIPNQNLDDRPEQAAQAISSRFNTNDYDIGHVFHNHLSNPDWQSGGIAQLRSLCNSQLNGGVPGKAHAWSGAFTNQSNSWIQLMTHEVGHQCGSLHTFNGSGESCNDAISDGHSYEIGSGSTIMSYQGTCGNGQNTTPLNEADNYFHVDNLYDMLDHVQNNASCHSVVNTGNSIPSVNINPCGVTQYRIPKNTPFRLKGEATDTDGDAITYCWEQYDEDGNGTSTQGDIGTQAANNQEGPNFRSFPPSTSSERVFPDMNTLISFVNDPFEALPNVARDLNFRLTVRDNNSSGGAFAIEDLNMQVDNSGPFNITSPTQNDNISSGQSLNITWDTGGSNNLCNVVDISLSIDGGRNFTIPIATQIQYSAGSFTYTLPNSIPSTDEGIIKIECMDYTCFSFFQITNPLSIISSCEATFTTLCNTEPLAALQGDPSLNLNMDFSSGQIVDRLQINVNGSDSPANTVRNGINGACQQMVFPSGANVMTPHDYFEFELTEDGSYFIDSQSNQFLLFYIFDADTYNPNSPCQSFIASNAFEDPAAPGTTSTSASLSITVELEKCKKYLAAGTFFNNPINIQLFFTGPGEPFDNTINLTPNTSYTYIAVNESNNLIEGVSSNADFTTLGGGIFEVEGVQHESTIDPNTWIGQSKSNLLLQGICLSYSDNNKQLDITSIIVDNDGDGFLSDVDCNDNDPAINPSASEIVNNNIDEDCDGIAQMIDADMDGYNSSQDCDDNNPAVNPGATEIPNNGVDEDCNGEALIIDNDMDGFNSDQDCDDNNAAVNPGAIEIPNNGVDEDCNGEALIIDNDMDGFNSDDDCDDNNAAINPSAVEIPNNTVDEDCNGEALIIDNDNDGFNSDQDCDDNNVAVNPGAIEIPNNGVDEDCDGEALIIDNDNDGFNSDQDCDDNNADINPNAAEIINNNIDEDCDGIAQMIDNDNDGFNSDEDCDDNNPDINPEAMEIPMNGIDEDCDGEDAIIDNDNDGFSSSEDCDDNDPAINPDAIEIPNNNIDEDCDGEALMIDEDMDGFNSDEDCDDNNADINPDATEIPNNTIDEDCNGEALIIDEDNDGFNSDEDCDDNNPDAYPGATEILDNGVDEDCNGSDLSDVHEIDGIKINLFPNPTTGIIFIEKEKDIHLNIKIINLNGQILYGSNSIKTAINQIDIQDFVPGTYLIEISNPDSDSKAFEKLIKVN